MRGVLTDLLDVLGLLLVAAGVGFQATGWIVVANVGSHGMAPVAVGAGLFASGVVVLAGSYYAARRGEAKE